MKNKIIKKEFFPNFVLQNHRNNGILKHTEITLLNISMNTYQSKHKNT